MAHPDHDQVIGRLVGARLRGVTARPSGAGSADVHPDAETWAAYVDSGLRADDVLRLETHLAGCSACRRLVAALVPEVSSAAVPAGREGEASTAGRGVVIPFPSRRVFAWMAVAASAFMALTLWSVSRLGGDRPVAEVAQSMPAPAPATPSRPAPTAAPVAATPTPGPQEQDARQADRSLDKLVRQRRSDAPVPATAATERGAAGAGVPAAPIPADQAAAARDRFSAIDKASEEKRTADASPAVNARDIQLQTNTVAGAAKPHGPSANQQAGYQQARNQPATAQAAAPPAQAPQAAAPQVAKAPTPTALPATPVPVVAAGPPPPAASAAADRPAEANEQAGVAESVAITTSPRARRAATRAERARGQKTTDAERETQARLKDEAGKEVAVGTLAAAVALPTFAEPGGRLQWRIAGGRRLESSSDGGTTWKARYTARGGLRAGSAPSIDSAWAVGERGLVLRFAVPGDWSVMPPPTDTTLVAVTATGAQSARVTAADGRVFETADGGATWTPAAGGAGPP